MATDPNAPGHTEGDPPEVPTVVTTGAAIAETGTRSAIPHRRARTAIRGRLTARMDLMLGLAGIGTLLVVWLFLTYGENPIVKPLFLPAPRDIAEGLGDFHQRGWLLQAIGRSFSRVTQSLFLVVLVGVPIGVLMGAYAPADAFLRKLVNGAKSVPTTGLAGLIVLWFSIEERAKIVFLFLGSIFYMIVLAKNAVASVNEEYLHVSLDLGAKPLQTVWQVLIPGALPQLWDAIAVCNGIMWTYIVLAEFINANEAQLGLGYLLYIGSRTNHSGKVFGTLIVIAVISSLTDWVFQSVRKRYMSW